MFKITAKEKQFILRRRKALAFKLKKTWKKDWKDVEEVPIKWIAQFREYDKSGLRNPENVEVLKESIKKKGLEEPLMLVVSPTEKKASLGEGNHRLVALEELGVKKVPVRLWIVKKVVPNSPSSNPPVKVKIKDRPSHQWYSTTKPSEMFYIK